MKVLVVDDDLIALAVLRAQIERLGHECVTAGDGHAGLAAYASERPHAVVTDWMMPGLDGAELCRRIAAAAGGRRPYLALLSATADAGAVGGLDGVVDAVLTKPLRRDDFAILLARAAERAALAAVPPA